MTTIINNNNNDNGNGNNTDNNNVLFLNLNRYIYIIKKYMLRVGNIQKSCLYTIQRESNKQITIKKIFQKNERLIKLIASIIKKLFDHTKYIKTSGSSHIIRHRDKGIKTELKE